MKYKPAIFIVISLCMILVNVSFGDAFSVEQDNQIIIDKELEDNIDDGGLKEIIEFYRSETSTMFSMYHFAIAVMLGIFSIVGLVSVVAPILSNKNLRKKIKDIEISVSEDKNKFYKELEEIKKLLYQSQIYNMKAKANLLNFEHGGDKKAKDIKVPIQLYLAEKYDGKIFAYNLIKALKNKYSFKLFAIYMPDEKVQEHNKPKFSYAYLLKIEFINTEDIEKIMKDIRAVEAPSKYCYYEIYEADVLGKTKNVSEKNLTYIEWTDEEINYWENYYEKHGIH